MMIRRYGLAILLFFSAETFICAQGKKDSTMTQKATLPPYSQSEDMIDIIIRTFHLKPKTALRRKQKVNFSVVPISTASVSGSRVLVSSVNIAFALGSRDNTNLSSIFLLPYTNFYSNIGVGTKQTIWTAGNTWNFPGEFRFSSLAQYTYGVGGGTVRSDREQVDFKNVRTYASANRSLGNHFFAGMGINYDRYYDVSPQGSADAPNSFQQYGTGTGSSSVSSGISINFLHDNRRNSINASNSLYYTVVYRINPSFLRNTGQWTSLYADVRKYIPIESEKRKILALWGMYWGAYGTVPYLNLPGTQLEFGGRSGRGYAQGRFRGKQMLYAESEFRFDISENKLFGGVVFANAQSFAEPNTNNFRYIEPAVGIGARVKFNKQSNTNLTLDFGVGKDSFNFYIGLGEFF
jgi:hypothetical protein